MSQSLAISVAEQNNYENLLKLRRRLAELKNDEASVAASAAIKNLMASVGPATPTADAVKQAAKQLQDEEARRKETSKGRELLEKQVKKHIEEFEATHPNEALTVRKKQLQVLKQQQSKAEATEKEIKESEAMIDLLQKQLSGTSTKPRTGARARPKRKAAKGKRALSTKPRTGARARAKRKAAKGKRVP